MGVSVTHHRERPFFVMGMWCDGIRPLRPRAHWWGQNAPFRSTTTLWTWLWPAQSWGLAVSSIGVGMAGRSMCLKSWHEWDQQHLGCLACDLPVAYGLLPWAIICFGRCLSFRTSCCRESRSKGASSKQSEAWLGSCS